MQPLLWILGLIWWGAACVRIYRLAHYYQIEEYMSARFLRWLFDERTRYLPTRPAAAFLAGMVAAAFAADTDVLAVVMLGITGVVAGWPPRRAEVKKPFVRTPRATRMLGAAFAVTAVLMTAAVLLGNPYVITGVGFLAVMFAPSLLIGGNILMTPVEAARRRGFVRQARTKLQQIDPTVVGITGSYGKTSTKTYVAQILNARYQALATPKSYNTLMGVTLSINTEMTLGVEYFVCEMGAYVPGEIAEICDLTHPSVGIITEVGPAHLERFGSLENTSIAKYELIKALPPDGVGVFNWDNPYVRDMYERPHPQTRIAVSRQLSPEAVPEGGPRFIASNIEESLDGLSFTVTDGDSGASEAFETALYGEHNVTNILLATAVAANAGIPLNTVARRVRALVPAESRLVRQSVPGGLTIINDAYSANPVGAVSSLRVLGMHTEGKRLLITPGMVELGPLMDAENQKLGEIAANFATDVILVGEAQTRPIAAGLAATNFPPDRVQTVETLAEAIAWYQTNLQAGDTVLFLNDLPDTY